MGNTKNWLSAIQLVDPGSGYTSAPTVTISGGGGAGASSYPPMLAADGTIEEIFLYSAGKGYTSAPTVTISGGGGSGATARALNTYVTMNAAWGDPTQNMAVKALLNDQHTGTEIVFDLTMSQQGPPFLVWGTGVAPVPGTSGDHLHTNNYYYSLTRLQTTGTISIGGEVLPVVGMTWMDHEYGAFGQSQGTTPKWILQDMQLDNGVHISNSISLTETPAPGSTIPSHATVQRADGTTYFVPSTISLGSPWTSPWTQKTYYRELLVVIPAFFAKITVTSLMDDQEFPATQSPVYEGIASAIGTFEGQAVSGYGWNEQAPL
jgi:predicted secreted hydrolase